MRASTSSSSTAALARSPASGTGSPRHCAAESRPEAERSVVQHQVHGVVLRVVVEVVGLLVDRCLCRGRAVAREVGVVMRGTVAAPLEVVLDDEGAAAGPPTGILIGVAAERVPLDGGVVDVVEAA